MLRAVSRLPIVRDAAEVAYDRHFERAEGRLRLFRGIYPDFASAVAAIPPGRDVGYDNAASARRLLDEQDAVVPADYPALFWLDRLLKNARVLFDWGGYIGTTYLTYRKYLNYSPGLEWIVKDVPAVVELGRQISVSESLPGLHFTIGFERLGEADILLAAGSLQFIEDPFGPLERAPTLPRYVLVNKTPLHDRGAAVTLQNLGTAIAPYHLFNRKAFTERFAALGYEAIDAWTSPGLGCDIPFHRDYSIVAFSGFLFEQRS
ncbi:MAG: methyltransferase, TIGR04325 family [Candidatus Eremiobacteraeota bacterium]|nr:methyltransferase, TIGR04325 family [Candidatus Eremiobacteraeota bacterium]